MVRQQSLTEIDGFLNMTPVPQSFRNISNTLFYKLGENIFRNLCGPFLSLSEEAFIRFQNLEQYSIYNVQTWGLKDFSALV